METQMPCSQKQWQQWAEKTMQTAQKHGIFSDPSEEALDSFRAELAEQTDVCGKEETV